MNEIILSGIEILFLGVLSRRGESTLSALSRDYTNTTERLTSVAHPSVYIVAEALRKAELIKIVKSASSKLTRYQITNDGEDALKANLIRFVMESKENSDDFKIALSMSDLIKNDDMIKLLTIRKNNLLKRFEELREVPAEIKEQKYYYKSFYKYPKQVIELETKFINEIIKELKAENEVQLKLLIQD